MNATPLQFNAPDQGEDLARADLYGLLAELFYAPPTAARLGEIALARGEDETPLGRAWNGLVDAARVTTAEQARARYESLFIGVGKPEVFLYGSYYMAGFLMEKPLAALRADLALMGLERAATVAESEDHIAALCEVMRWLIASDDVAHANPAGQQRFFARHVQPWVARMVEAVTVADGATEVISGTQGFYGALARLAGVFFEIEAQAFDMS